MIYNRKQIAVMLLEGIVTNHAEEVYLKHTTSTFIHHNIFFKGDRDLLLKALIENNIEYPSKKLTIKYVIAEENYVTVFSHVDLDGHLSYATVHLFRFNEDKIEEMWDFSQEIPQTIINEHGAF